MVFSQTCNMPAACYCKAFGGSAASTRHLSHRDGALAGAHHFRHAGRCAHVADQRIAPCVCLPGRSGAGVSSRCLSSAARAMRANTCCQAQSTCAHPLCPFATSPVRTAMPAARSARVTIAAMLLMLALLSSGTAAGAHAVGPPGTRLSAKQPHAAAAMLAMPAVTDAQRAGRCMPHD